MYIYIYTCDIHITFIGPKFSDQIPSVQGDLFFKLASRLLEKATEIPENRQVHVAAWGWWLS